MEINKVGKFLDGITSQPYDVTFNFDNDNLFIKIEADELTLKWQDLNLKDTVKLLGQRDDVDSIALDAGNPRIRPVSEPIPNGGYLNAGAYGGTAFASKSAWPLKSDSNFDGVVNFADFAYLAKGWRDALG